MSEPALKLVPNEDGELVHDHNPETAKLRGLLFAAEQDNRRLEKALRDERAKLERALEDRDELAKLQRDKFYPKAEELFREWQDVCGHPRAEFDANRIRLALRVVKRYDKHRDKLSLVIQHGKHLAWVNPKTGHKKDSFGLLFRDAEQIENRATEFYTWSRRQAA
jgi:uncharacterized protein with PIN domain